MSLRRPLPPTCFFVGLVLLVVLGFVLPGPRLIGSPWRYLGAAPVLFGAWIVIRADALFRRLGTEIKPFRPSRLVVTGVPFRVSRHPMYLGFIAILTGAAILAGTASPFLVVLLLAVLLDRHFVVPEERHMEEQFGEAYRAYKTRVWRWL